MIAELLQKYSVGNFFYPIKSEAEGILIKKDFIIEVVQKLKEDEDLLFDQLIDVTATDNLQSEAMSSNDRFTLIYTFLSLKKNNRFFLFTNVSEENPVIDSITQIFETANWYERECYDLFGITFKNHPSLQRIMNDYNFKGYPLRKDFPLTGYEEVRYDENLKKVVYEPVDLKQEFRDFDNESPWEGIKDIVKEGLDK
ncbi:MAG: NADH-quinone oxidoreductase subunit C [Pelagibacteraceae bacterium]|nr:NADH-quinone oxidoreductase subunit C [Pelagibacteraceae bacterium]|tara:strand:+ start:983 stop:1576 length:594 start_codon:yes stop_codon:yes gene_type:complete